MLVACDLRFCCLTKRRWTNGPDDGPVSLAGHAKVCRQSMWPRDSYRSTDKWWTEQMVCVSWPGMPVQLCIQKSQQNDFTFWLKSGLRQTLAQLKAKSKKWSHPMSKHVSDDLGYVKGITVPTLITYTTTITAANDCGRQRCRLSPPTDN